MTDNMPEVDVLVDALGRACPIPVIDLANAVEQARAGALVRLLADDPTAAVDIPIWCRLKGHALEARSRDGSVLTFDVRTRGENSEAVRP